MLAVAVLKKARFSKLLAVPCVLGALVVAPAYGFAAPPSAGAGGVWQEAHQTSDDVRVTVSADGVANVVHHLRFRVVAGHFKSFDVSGLDPQADISPTITALPEKGGELAAHLEPSTKTPGAVKIVFDDPKGVSRGAYAIDVSYRLDLVATKKLVRDGAMWRLSWTAPPSSEGHDGARVVFELPSAPTEPRLASPEQATTTLATLHRSPEKDELELVRAHIPRGEAVTWSARVDPKAFPGVTSPELRPAPRTGAESSPSRLPGVLIACALASLAGALAFALRAKQAAFVRACEAMSCRARPLVPVPWAMGPFVYGAVAVVGLAELLWASPTWGAIFIVVAMALGAHRTPAVIARPRGPGRWREVEDEAAIFARKPSSSSDIFDLGTRKGWLLLASIVVGVAAASVVLSTRLSGASIALPLEAAVLVPLFVTGTSRQLPLAPSELASRLLRPVRDLLGRFVDPAHVELRCMARYREGMSEFDEVRLRCVPQDRIPGLRSIELAHAAVAPGARTAMPEVLVRFDDASEAAAKVAEMARGLPIVVGRVPEERVLRLAPRVPTPVFAARLMARVALELEGRRATDRTGDPPPASRPWQGPERRGLLRKGKRPGARPSRPTLSGSPVPA